MKVRNLRNYILIILFLVIFLIFSFFSPPFITVRNLMSMFRQISFIGIMAVGATFVMLTGGIDLSVGSILALAGMICARLFQQFGLNAFFAVIITLVAGCLMGLINGKIVTRFQIPPFITTLATMGIFRGLVLFFAPRQYGFVSNIAITNTAFITFGKGKFFGIYNPIIFFFLIAISLALFLYKSKFGTYVYAVGSNEQSALMSGINVEKVKTSVYIISGACSAFAGILWTSRLMTTTTEMGIGNELDVIAAIVVGGTSIYGGRGGVIQTIIGALFIGTLSNGLSMLGLPEFYQPLAKSSVIILAASLDYFLFIKKENMDDNLKALKSKEAKMDLKNYKFKSFKKTEFTTIFLEVEKINKSFDDNQVLKDVSLEIKKGEVHALIGENGAGKSTLIKIITGVYQKNSGKIKIHGENIEINDPKQAQRVGIGTIFQELSLIPTLNVARNILLGREPTNKTFSSFINNKKLFLYAQKVLDQLKFDVPLKTNIEDLSIAKKQMVEIAKAFSTKATLLIMDEPTASLSLSEKYKLFKSIQRLQERGTSILFISHILEEVLEIANTISILRDGQLVCTSQANNLNKQKIIQYMVGHELIEKTKKSLHMIKKPILSVNKLSCRKKFSEVSFDLHEGEILGLTGLVGAGRSEIAKAIFGLEIIDSGEIYLNGKNININSPRMAMKNNIAFIPEDRKKEGLVMIHFTKNNLTMANLEGISNRQGIINKKKEIQMASQSISELDVRPPKLNVLVSELSGGNQQKVVLGKWLSRKPKILIVDEPTVGIDIGAKHEIYNMLQELADHGVAILFISSDFTEVLRICSRIMVMRRGKIVSIDSRSRVSQKKIMEDALG